MKQKKRLQTAVTITYVVVLLSILVFSVYMKLAEHSSVYQARRIEECETVDHYTETTVEDPSDPMGIHKEYSFKLSNISATKDYLAFYVVHQYVEVRIDRVVVYSLTSNENNRIGASPSSNWVFIPLDQADNGRDVQVTITPVYQSVVNRGIEFMLGARSDIVLNRLRTDLPQIILSVLCIFLGIVLVLIQPFLVWRKKATSWEMFYLGSFLLIIGIWRITDTRFSPILFSKNPMALGYITIASLFISCVPLLLFIREHYEGHKKILVSLTALAGSVVAFIALLCQVFQIAELRETLFLCHMMLIISMVVILLVSVIHIGSYPEARKQRWMVMILVPAALMDLLFFYWKKTSSGAMFTVFALLMYTLVRFIVEIFNINRRMYIDALTGLFNRSRWNKLVDHPSPVSETTGVMMFDLNRLKHTNDTMGHEMGDKMILDFANILREVLTNDCMVFRWGGDEFTVLASDTDHDKMDCFISDISTAVEAHNSSGEQPEIYFAVGYALAIDYPALSCEELMKKADEKMYHNKSDWYRKNVPDYHL